MLIGANGLQRIVLIGWANDDITITANVDSIPAFCFTRRKSLPIFLLLKVFNHSSTGSSVVLVTNPTFQNNKN